MEKMNFTQFKFGSIFSRGFN